MFILTRKALGAMVAAAALSAICSTGAQAGAVWDFTGPFDPSNWQLSNDKNVEGTALFNGTTSVAITGGDQAFSGNTDLVMTCPLSECLPFPIFGTWNFDWDYSTNDKQGPFFDPAGYLLNGQFTQLTSDDGPDNQSGSAWIQVGPQDVIGYRVTTIDGAAGAAVLTISGFHMVSEPSDFQIVPEPGTLAIFGLGLAGLGYMKRRRAI